MGWTSDLLDALAQLLADNHLGTYRPDGAAYTTGETAITVKKLPQTPHRCVVLATYPVSDDPDLADVTVAVQFRTRGAGPDPRDVDDLADSIFDLLHGQRNLRLGPIATTLCWRQSWTTLGQDPTGLWSRSDNYYITAARPTATRPD
jgi:hypothetical protein